MTIYMPHSDRSRDDKAVERMTTSVKFAILFAKMHKASGMMHPDSFTVELAYTKSYYETWRKTGKISRKAIDNLNRFITTLKTLGYWQ